MNRLQQALFKTLLLLCFISTAAYGQKQTKTYKEVFNAGPETIIDLNTSNADIEFETTDGNQIEIEAVIELEGASEEEAERYFKDGAIEIKGNSQKVEIRTGTEKNWLFARNAHGPETFIVNGANDFQFKFDTDSLFTGLPSLDMESFVYDLAIVEEMPPMPRLPRNNFDYEAFKKDGEKYLKEWQKEFSKGFDKEYEKRLEEWSKRIEERAKAKEKQLEKREKARKERLEKMEEARQLREEKRAEAMEKMVEAREKSRAALAKARAERNVIIHSDGQHDAPSIFYFSSDGKSKNYKVKKTIKIKMPKGTKIQMNVRHGEVKLAENTMNINANLSYSSLSAVTIDGEETTIVASYSPVTVQNWNYGQLRADYSDRVDLREVTDLRLSTTSSDVTIDRLLKKAYITNKFGPLRINHISKNFNDMDISLQNAELYCQTPETPFVIYVNSTSSKFVCPSDLTLDRTKNLNTVVHKGYHINKNKGRSIVINSKYSDVIFE
ncbi:hypothetical protein FK220_000640 [Flavobacteriaceae bacterium TP-CH-4]|uniref:Adhesin domain-containing protein n=1 Tax=Pelagihabitans pacificus TaxID=2696054 RepID=A0A967E3Y2_9FLAO|nr:hypothetical protein [Pelagihabitans pacificus]NHF57827.1 hypothetical protein [Pelagihabitans pacificus]